MDADRSFSREVGGGSSGGELSTLMKRCPVDGALLVPGNDLLNLLYISLALDDGITQGQPGVLLKVCILLLLCGMHCIAAASSLFVLGEGRELCAWSRHRGGQRTRSGPDDVPAARTCGSHMMQGGYHTAQQASRAWMLRMTEWLAHPLAGAPSGIIKGNHYEVGGLRRGTTAAHVLVIDRRSVWLWRKLGVVLSLAMRNMYQSRMGHMLMKEGFFSRLKSMSENLNRTWTFESVSKVRCGTWRVHARVGPTTCRLACLRWARCAGCAWARHSS